MSAPLGYRILARRLARDLAQIVVVERPEVVIGDGDYDRLFLQAERTLARFRIYEATQRRVARG